MGVDRFLLAGHRRETYFFSIWREIDVARPATLIRRNVIVCPGGKIARCRASIRRNDKQMAALAFVPMRPVAVEEGLPDVRVYFALFPFLVAPAIAIIVIVLGC